MTDKPEVLTEWSDGRVPILRATYQPGHLIDNDSATYLSERLVSAYRELTGGKEILQSRACVIEICSEVAGSPIVRSIFELYKVVHANNGTLYCANYPEDYLHSLTSLGLPALPGFKMAKTVREALELAAK